MRDFQFGFEYQPRSKTFLHNLGRLLPDTTGSERPETDVEQQRKLSAANRCIGVFMMARMAGLSQIYRPIQGRIHVSKSL